MTTMGNLIDRLLRDWLEPADDQPARLVLSTGISKTDTTITYDAGLIGPEELEVIGPGTLLEVDSEEIIVGDISESTNTLTGLTRAANGTTAATHDADAFIYPRRLWRRRVLFDALADQVVALYPELYQVRSSELITASLTSFTEVPSADADQMVTPMWFYGQLGGTTGTWRQIPMSDSDLLDAFPPSSTGKAFYMRADCGGSATGYLTYKARFARPLYEVDDLEDDLGLEPSWEAIVMVGAAAYLVAGRELDLVTQKRLSDQLEQQNYPPDSPSKVRDNLLRYQTFLLGQAKQDLQQRWPVTVSMGGIW